MSTELFFVRNKKTLMRNCRVPFRTQEHNSRGNCGFMYPDFKKQKHINCQSYYLDTT